MKKLFTMILINILIITSMPLTGAFKIFAQTYYSYGCPNNQFEVSYIEDDGTFSKISCHDTLADAKNVMKTNNDYVIRYSKSYSPTKIVAMNSGLAYTYPGRRKSSTMYLYQNPTDRNNSLYKNTYVANHYEMTYIKTCGTSIYDISLEGKGFIRVDINGFEGYADLEYTDLVPSKFINKNIPIWLGGNNTYEHEDPFQVICKQNYFQIEKNGNYYDLVFHYYRAYPKSGVNGNEALSYKISVDNAANYLETGMKKDVKYYSSDGINFYSDSKLTKLVATCYNYYQFLPLRTKTYIHASTIDEFLKTIKGSSSIMTDKASTFVSGQNNYGCNALIVYAMACLESAYGTSGYAKNRNNLFGWSAYDDSPNDASYFSSVAVCVNEQMGRNLNWFLDYSNRRYFGNCVGNKGAGINVQYASDPYWGMKIASIAYSIDKFANNNNGKLTDHNKYTLGLLKGNYNDVIYDANVEWDAKIYQKSSGKNVLYTGRYGSHYQKDLVFALIKQVGNRYKVQTSNPIVDGKLVTEDGILKYDWKKSVGYINVDDVTLLNNFDSQQETPVDNTVYKAVVSLREVELNDTTLTLSGVGALDQVDFTDIDTIKHTINIKNIIDNKTIYSKQATTIDSDGFDLFDGHNYKYAGFEVSIDLADNKLVNGSYYIELNISNDSKSASTFLYNSDPQYRLLASDISNTNYKIRMNDEYNYRLEVDKISLPDELSLNNINKASARSSLVSLDDITIDDKGNLNIQLHGFIHYLNYNIKDNISYDIYLVENKNKYYRMNSEFYDDGINYTKELNSKYKLDNITIKSSINLKDVEQGNYIIYVKMKNINDSTTYIDVCELINYGFEMPSINLQGLNYQLVTSKLRKRIELNVKGD